MCIRDRKITKDKLYSIAKKLYGVKDELERHLSLRTNELFDIEDKIVLYDLTNTYFEGRKQGSKLAKFGRSKEKRSDAKLVVLALVINPQGFIKYSSISVSYTHLDVYKRQILYTSYVKIFGRK